MAITEKLKKYITPETKKQFLRYLVTGGLAAGTEYSLFYVLNILAGLSLILSNSAAYTSGFVISFILNRVWSFESKGHLGRQLLLYSVLFGINLVLSNILVTLNFSERCEQLCLPKYLNLNRFELLIGNYNTNSGDILKPYEARVYLYSKDMKDAWRS
jgi:putative flippase GtrA